MKAFLMMGGLMLVMGRVIAGEGWELWAPREEVRPVGVVSESGGLVLETGEGGHWYGGWKKVLPVAGGGHVRLAGRYRHQGVAVPRRSVVVRVLWQDEAGKPVNWEVAPGAGYRGDQVPRAEPEYPVLGALGADGWGEIDEVMEVPKAARQAVVELTLQWAGQARAEWQGLELTAVAAPPARRVRLATVHFRPEAGQTAAEKVALFEPLIADAAKQRADLAVLPETLTYYRSGKSLVECAEPIPGPSTAAFGEMAKRHGLHLVVGLVERDGPAAYNVAVLIDDAGEVIGKYRKVCLPRSEIEAGLTPGSGYPVFETKLGRIGMMVCYDGFFPEVARELTNRGAEVIAWPVWGCNPLLAQARACENHVYLISSTYHDGGDWMISGIYDHYGQVLAKAERFGTVVVTEVDLAAKARWNSLGNFKAQLESHRP